VPDLLRVLHFTDTHIHADCDKRLLGVDTQTTLRQLVQMSMEIEGAPDLILLTGDLSNDESERSYDRLLELLDPLKSPICFIPGNHDSSETLRARFTAHKGNCT
jgi:3',5'-cyclic-AMP phosphodiesterase